MNSPGQENGYLTAWAAPEVLEGSGTTTQEADVFAFGMVVIEVGLRALPHLVLEVEIRLTFECYLRFLREGHHLVNSRPRTLLQLSSMENGRPVRRRSKD